MGSQRKKKPIVLFHNDGGAQSEDVLQAIKPIYEDLSKDELLERCLGGFTQNANESLNQLIWRIASKKLSGSKQIVEFASYVAACTFNEGASAFLTFLSDMNVSVGPSAHEYARLANSNRINRAEIQAEQQSKDARIKQRLERKEAEDIEAAAGSLLYGAGIDDSVVSGRSIPIFKDSLRPPSSRPSSARPAAPKLRWKPDFSGKNNESALMENDTIIVDNFDVRNDDNNSMVVLEIEANDYHAVNDSIETVNGDNTQDHGYLVAQILETQRELAKVNPMDLVSNNVNSESKQSLKKNTKSTVTEVEKLRSTIQTLTRATHPMGKLLDFLQEDVELMQKELVDWQNQFSHLHTQLQVEKAESEATAHPLQKSFDGIQAGIRDQLVKIYQIKLHIMKNNYKIQQLLLGRV